MYSLAMRGGRAVSAIRRIGDGHTRWRVIVESWRSVKGFQGRFVFEPEGSVTESLREGPSALIAESREELVRAAHDVSDDDLRALCRSLG
jgi:hypothetical protein